jgi:hypothetical protein
MRNNKPTPRSRELLPWGRISADLLEAELAQSWRAAHTSFSKWLVAQAAEQGKSQQAFWRYLAAGKEYRSRRQALARRGVRLPKLEELPQGVSAESIELLTKIERIAPAKLVTDIERDVLTGQIEKKVLRGIWESYSPLLKGKTARGRASRATPLRASRGERQVSDVLASLRLSKGKWLAKEISLYELYIATEVSSSGSVGALRCDALIVSRIDSGAEVQIHGLVVFAPGQEFLEAAARAQDLATAVDRLWVVTDRSISAADLEKFPDDVGALKVSLKGGVTVLKNAALIDRERSPGESLARGILSRLRA